MAVEYLFPVDTFTVNYPAGQTFAVSVSTAKLVPNETVLQTDWDPSNEKLSSYLTEDLLYTLARSGVLDREVAPGKIVKAEMSSFKISFPRLTGNITTRDGQPKRLTFSLSINVVSPARFEGWEISAEATFRKLNTIDMLFAMLNDGVAVREVAPHTTVEGILIDVEAV